MHGSSLVDNHAELAFASIDRINVPGNRVSKPGKGQFKIRIGRAALPPSATSSALRRRRISNA